MTLSKAQLIDSIFKPDSITGISQWITRDYLETTPLKLGNNGNGRHGIYYGDKRYNWEAKRGKYSKVLELRTCGFNENYLHGANRPIHPDIDKHHKSIGCVVCGSNSDLVTDHKNDLYNDPRVLNIATQTIDDFQCLCNHCNLQKRQISVKTRETGKRIGATSIPQMAIHGIDFIEGDENYDSNDINAMVGTYWYDPVAFNKAIKNKYCKFMIAHYK